MIKGIPAADYIDVRDEVAPFLRSFADRSCGMCTAESLDMDIINRNRQIWCINDFQALGMTRVMNEAVSIDACAGIRRKEWQEEFDEAIRSWARQLGKKYVIALVRPGWSQWGKERGYKEVHRQMMLEL